VLASVSEWAFYLVGQVTDPTDLLALCCSERERRDGARRRVRRRGDGSEGVTGGYVSRGLWRRGRPQTVVAMSRRCARGLKVL
jgi:hypothetical protein